MTVLQRNKILVLIKYPFEIIQKTKVFLRASKVTLRHRFHSTEVYDLLEMNQFVLTARFPMIKR